mgnify:CR=1 FL=1
MWEYDQSMKLKVGLAEMLKGGVIMDVMSAEQAEVAETDKAAAGANHELASAFEHLHTHIVDIRARHLL